MSNYRKAIVAVGVAVLIAALTALQAALTDEYISPTEIVSVILAALGALAVYVVPNDPYIDVEEAISSYVVEAEEATHSPFLGTDTDE